MPLPPGPSGPQLLSATESSRVAGAACSSLLGSYGHSFHDSLSGRSNLSAFFYRHNAYANLLQYILLPGLTGYLSDSVELVQALELLPLQCSQRLSRCVHFPVAAASRRAFDPMCQGRQDPLLGLSCSFPLQLLALPRSIRHWSLTTLREKLVKIGQDR